MCGIAGIYTKKTDNFIDIADKMAKLLQHRGPDNSSIYSFPKGAFVHTRLSIIDLEHGNQPLFSKGQDIQLVANGEIYNFIELRKELELQNCHFSSNSDCETIVHAYELDNTNFIHRLNGMFAFAIHDSKKDKLILARDRLGIKPLFYTVQNNSVIFASEIKALISALDHTPDIIEKYLIQFLQNQFIGGRNTIFEGIYKVLPGEIIEFDHTLSITRKQYWDPSTSPQPSDFEQNPAGFDGLFRQVMLEHIRSDVPFGLFLSGGADSAILLAMLSELHHKPISTFSIGFKERETHNETNDAEFIANKFNSQHKTFLLDKHDIFGRIPLMTWSSDELMRDYASLPTLALAEYASRDLKVVFSGEGGDEAFAGYRRYHPKPVERFLKSLIRPDTQGFRNRGQLNHLATFLHNQGSLKNSDYRENFRQAWQNCPSSWSFMQKAQYTDIKTALPDNLLVKADRMLMAHGLEGRVPFVDHRIIQYGLSLPDELKYHNKQGKYFLKNWAESYLPRDYLHRKKRGFYVPVDTWLTDHTLKKSLQQKLVTNKSLQNWFKTDSIGKIFQSDQHIKKSSRHIMCFLQFAIWHKMLDQRFDLRPDSLDNVLDWL